MEQELKIIMIGEIATNIIMIKIRIKILIPMKKKMII
jgi:hypothetical protein